MTHQDEFEIDTRSRGTQDITASVARIVRASGVRCGLAHVFVQHTSASLLLTENADPDVRRDLETLARRWAPDGDLEYRHRDEGPDDMAAHARHALTGSALSVPVLEGTLRLGSWQGIYLWEHRTTPHRRRIVVTVLGD